MANASTAKLEIRIARSTATVIAVQAVALFAAAGTLRYWQGWVFVVLQLVSMTATNVYLLRHDPELLERRLVAEERGERQGVHKVFWVLLRLLGLAVLIVAGLDRRFGWSTMPPAFVAGGCLTVAAGTLVMFLVFRENTHASSVVEVSARQTVVATGPYRLVRHPMYAGALLGIAATPLALGSFCAEAFFPVLCVLFVVRLLAEERLLSHELPGYVAYMSRTRKRLVPGVW